MTEFSEIDYILIVKFLTNQSSPEDLDKLRNKMETDENFNRNFIMVRNAWNRVEIEKDLSDETLYRDLKKVMSFAEGKGRAAGSRSPFSSRWTLSAVIILFSAIIFSWLLFNNNHPDHQEIERMNSLETHQEGITVLTLIDGTKVTVNGRSKIEYPDKFADNVREVYLEGEAYFDVARDDARQFIVRTPDIVIRVYGTRFNVRCYPDDPMVETTLVEGSISLHKLTNEGMEEEEIIMEPNQQVIFYKANDITEKRTEPSSDGMNVSELQTPKLVHEKQIDTKRFISWSFGRLSFTNETLETLALTLERRYNISIHFEDEDLKQYRFTGQIENENIDQVMTAIGLASSIDYLINNNDVWIKNKTRLKK